MRLSLGTFGGPQLCPNKALVGSVIVQRILGLFSISARVPLTRPRALQAQGLNRLSLLSLSFALHLEDGSGELPDRQAVCISFWEMQAICSCPHGDSNPMANTPSHIHPLRLWVSACKVLEVSLRGCCSEWKSMEGLAGQGSVHTEPSVRSGEGCVQGLCS